jgi:hypothetical protein
MSSPRPTPLSPQARKRLVPNEKYEIFVQVFVIAQGNLEAVGVFRLHARQRKRVRAVPACSRAGTTSSPTSRRAVEPQTGNQDCVRTRYRVARKSSTRWLSSAAASAS